MDKEKLNKVAEEYAAMETEDYGDIDERTTAYNNCIYGFKAGAEWLLTQPLSERLTEEEKEEIRAIYRGSRNLLRRYNRQLGIVSSKESERTLGSLCSVHCEVLNLLEGIFGTSLFNDKSE